jgi:hypothetical protein
MARRKITWFAVAAYALLFAGAGCEDEGDDNNLPTSSGGGAGGGTSSTSTGTAGGGGVGGVVGCTADAPISGETCSPEAQMCTFGNTCCQCSNLGDCTVWECANPDLNAQDVCPMVTAGTPCEGTYTPSCFSCTDGVPGILVCDLNAGQYVVGEITVCQ